MFFFFLFDYISFIPDFFLWIFLSWAFFMGHTVFLRLFLIFYPKWSSVWEGRNFGTVYADLHEGYSLGGT